MKKKLTGNILQIFSHWATILGFLTSIFFAGYAIYLNMKLEQTDKKVTLLEQLNSKSTLQTEKIIEIITELKKQSNYQYQYLSTNERQYSIFKNQTRIDSLFNSYDYWYLVQKLKLTVDFKLLIPKYNFISFPNEQKQSIIDSIKVITELMLKNPYVVSRDSLYWRIRRFKDQDLGEFSYAMLHQNEETFLKERLRAFANDYVRLFEYIHKNSKF